MLGLWKKIIVSVDPRMPCGSEQQQLLVKLEVASKNWMSLLVTSIEYSAPYGGQ